MLPDGFRFEWFVDGPALYLGNEVVATASPANYDPDPPWRLCMNPDRQERRTVFRRNQDEAERYMAAWARKWQDRLREQNPVNPMSCYTGLNMVSQQEAKYPRRRKRRG